MPEVEGVSLPFLPIGGLKELRKPSLPVIGTENKVSFKDIFGQELDKLKFSAHAQSRMISREIDLSNSDIARLEDAVQKAESKGANESLVMLDDKAFIISIANKTVITVVNKEQMSDNVITNIDSAIIA